MNVKTRELEFETNIVDAMVAAGWVHNADNTGWDPELGLYTPDAVAWLEEQYPDEFTKIVPESLTGPARTSAIRGLMGRLSKILGQRAQVDVETGRETGGLLGALRTGFSYTYGGPAARFGPMAGFAPANPLLTQIQERYEGNRLRVMRQVRFDSTTQQTLDLVLLVNGVPVVTMELKTDNTQSVRDGVQQYMHDRKPTVKTPILRPGRCLVHFVVSNQNVEMTTVLAGRETKFIPFDKGHDGHAGNPPSETGSATDYLWREVLAPDMLLRILQSYAVRERDGVLIFPRYHQLRAVEKVTADSLRKGAGERYLIWHSAGSGKTKTIAWLSHRLARLHDDAGEKVFDSIIVISDRTILDDQLRDAVQLLGGSRGYVVGVGERKGEAKSPILRKALKEGGHIITCTLQSFPEVLKRIEGDEDLHAKKWCVIADEAHSSQSGETSRKLRQLLAATGVTPNEDEELSTEDLLLAQDAAVAHSANMTFVACTATPKHRTLRMFGRKTDDGRWEAFDTYTMAQAIEEKFILDVLKRYSTFTMLAQLRDTLQRDEVVDSQAAVSEFMRFVRLSDITIAQKVEIVVEHFRKNVAGSLNGTAKAMVVTESRMAAVKWAQSLNRYLVKKNYGEMHALVAFSETVTDERGQEYTERSMNKVSDVAKHFAQNDEAKVLIVADKFQTGFDEPRLCAMYVDKVLTDITAVQTLSRLNRAYPNKPDPVVLDFRNDPLVIQEAFETYYTDAYIAGETDPNVLFDLADVIDTAGFYDHSDIQKVSDTYLSPTATGEALQKQISPIVERWKQALRQAGSDTTAKDRIWEFKANLRKYVHAWDFMSQIISFEDTLLHRRAILAQLLSKNLHFDDLIERVDISGVELTGVAVVRTSEETDYGLSEGSQDALDAPTFQPVSGGPGQRLQEQFDELVRKVNEYLTNAGIDISNEATRTWLDALFVAIREDEELREMLRNNTAARLLNSTKFADSIRKAIADVAQKHQDASALMQQGETEFTGFVSLLLNMLQLSETEEH